MPIYAEITDGVITSRVVWDGQAAHPDADDWVGPLDDMEPEPQIGWLYDGATFTPPPEPEDGPV